MKLGPFNITRTATNGKKPPTTEIGWSGNEIFAGRLSPSQDYNELLNPPQSYDVYDKMRRGDGTVAASLAVLKQPLLNADWYIEPASDSVEDKDIAAFIEQNLKEGLNISWRAVLQQIFLHFDYGNAPFEKVWRIENGMVHLRKLAFRHPKTITKWETDDHGGLKGIVQTTSPTYTETPIDVSKLIVFINDLEGANFHGTSILRAAYKHWYYVDNLERVEAIAIEKRGQGVDTIMLDTEADDQRRLDAERAAMTMHGHEKMYYVGVKDRNEYEVKGIQGDVLNPDPAIQRHQLAIVRSMITEFLTMGSGSTGSLAMHKDKSSMTMLALGGKANVVCDTFQMHLIRPWVDYNWAVSSYPRLRYTHIDARPLAEIADAVSKFSLAGVPMNDLEAVNAFRALMDLAKLEELPEPEPVPVAEPEEDAELENMPTERLAALVTAGRRVLRDRRAEVPELLTKNPAT